MTGSIHCFNFPIVMSRVMAKWSQDNRDKKESEGRGDPSSSSLWIVCNHSRKFLNELEEVNNRSNLLCDRVRVFLVRSVRLNFLLNFRVTVLFLVQFGSLLTTLNLYRLKRKTHTPHVRNKRASSLNGQIACSFLISIFSGYLWPPFTEIELSRKVSLVACARTRGLGEQILLWINLLVFF